MEDNEELRQSLLDPTERETFRSRFKESTAEAASQGADRAFQYASRIGKGVGGGVTSGARVVGEGASLVKESALGALAEAGGGVISGIERIREAAPPTRGEIERAALAAPGATVDMLAKIGETPEVVAGKIWSETTDLGENLVDRSQLMFPPWADTRWVEDPDNEILLDLQQSKKIGTAAALGSLVAKSFTGGIGAPTAQEEFGEGLAKDLEYVPGMGEGGAEASADQMLEQLTTEGEPSVQELTKRFQDFQMYLKDPSTRYSMLLMERQNKIYELLFKVIKYLNENTGGQHMRKFNLKDIDVSWWTKGSPSSYIDNLKKSIIEEKIEEAKKTKGLYEYYVSLAGQEGVFDESGQSVRNPTEEEYEEALKILHSIGEYPSPRVATAGRISQRGSFGTEPPPAATSGATPSIAIGGGPRDPYIAELRREEGERDVMEVTVGPSGPDDGDPSPPGGHVGGGYKKTKKKRTKKRKNKTKKKRTQKKRTQKKTKKKRIQT